MMILWSCFQLFLIEYCWLCLNWAAVQSKWIIFNMFSVWKRSRTIWLILCDVFLEMCAGKKDLFWVCELCGLHKYYCNLTTFDLTYNLLSKMPFQPFLGIWVYDHEWEWIIVCCHRLWWPFRRAVQWKRRWCYIGWSWPCLPCRTVSPLLSCKFTWQRLALTFHWSDLRTFGSVFWWSLQASRKRYYRDRPKYWQS